MGELVDGRTIAREILADVRKRVNTLGRPPRLSIITCSPDVPTRSYLELKKRRAAAVGIQARVIELLPQITTPMLIAMVQRIATESDGVVVQLPLPPHIDREAVLAAVPTAKDPDGFSYGDAPDACLPPVVGAIEQIAERHQVNWVGTRVAVVGAGRLVGAPAARYLASMGAEVTVLEKGDPRRKEVLARADVIVSGVGVPKLITYGEVKDGVIVFDAGTSEEGGKLAGDVAPDVATRAALFTPVPGGIGPITVAVLLDNLVSLLVRAT